MSTGPNNAAEVAQVLAARFDGLGIDYAVGRALALGFWGEPRGTLDIDVTLFVSPREPGVCVNYLLAVGCELSAAAARRSLAEDGFCRVEFQGTRVDVFLPTRVFFLEADDDHTLIRTHRKETLRDLRSLGEIKLFFKPHQFLRVHRNFMVNLRKIRAINQRPDGWQLRLQPPVNQVLPIGRTHETQLWRAFEN